MDKKAFFSVILKAGIYGICIMAFIICTNILVDASSVIRPQHTEMAKLALAGHIVSRPENYNERVFQVCIVNNMENMPDTIVIGSSRGMFLGKDITGYDSIYNNCVSGACLEDYYALLGLYYDKFRSFPKRVIIETSPWVFYSENPEARWMETDNYNKAANLLYKTINGKKIPINNSSSKENPFVSYSYFRYNVEQFIENGYRIPKEDAHISTDESEAADNPDGTIRYKAGYEDENDERLQRVLNSTGVLTYENSDKMTEIDAQKASAFEKLIDYLSSAGTEVIIYMQPLSVTQCEYSFDKNLNPAYKIVEEYLNSLAHSRKLEIHGGYDARDFGLTDNRFIDSKHLDKIGTDIVWNYK